jgi:hypothetical protein
LRSKETIATTSRSKQLLTLAESRGIEVEVEGDDSNDESLEAVATTITPTPQANTRSFFGSEVNELDRLDPVGGCCNKDDEGLFDTYSSDDPDEEQEEEPDEELEPSLGKTSDGDDDDDEGDFNLQFSDDDELDEEQEEEPDEELEPSLGETSDTARTATMRTEPTLALPIPPKQISREKYEAFENMRTRKKGVGIPQGMRHCKWTDPEDKITYYFLCEKGFHVEVHTQGEEKRPYVIPSRYKVVDKTAETKEKKKAIAEADARVAEADARVAEDDASGTLTRMHKILHRSRFGFSDDNRRLIAGLIVFQPKVASVGFEQIFSVYLHAFLNEAGIETNSNQVYALNPKRNTMENLVLDLAADSIIWCRDSLQRSGYYSLSFDKGDCSNGKAGGTSKIISWVDVTLTSEHYPDGQVLTMPLDGDKTGDDSPDVAQGVASSIERLDLGNSVSGQTSTQDSGGGGTLLSVHLPLITLGVLKEDALNGNCTLHNVNLEIAVPFNKVFKGINSGTDKEKQHLCRDAEQLLYAAFAWENRMESDHLHAWWDIIVDYALVDIDVEGEENEAGENNMLEINAMFVYNDEGVRNLSFIAAQHGSPSRWWTIGNAAAILYKTLPMRKVLAQTFDDMTTKKSAARDTAQTFLSLAKEPELVCDLAFMKCHHEYYIVRHMKFFQDADGLCLKAGFQGFAVFARVFVMHQDYKTMQEEYGTLKAFKDLQNELEGLTEEQRAEQKGKIDDFLRYGLEENKKMFGMNWLGANSFLAGFGEFETARLVCQRLLGYPLCANRNKTVWDSKEKAWTSTNAGM